MVGSSLFALGSFPPYANGTNPTVVGITYFVGSIFFTSAGYLQFVQTINTPEEAGEGRHRTRLFAWQPHRIDWWSASVQSIGTLLFNRSTFNAMDAALSISQQERLVWAPDMFGSIAFMIASTLAGSRCVTAGGAGTLAIPRGGSWRSTSSGRSPSRSRRSPPSSVPQRVSS